MGCWPRPASGTTSKHPSGTPEAQGPGGMRVTRRAPGQWPAIWPPGWDGPAGCECCSLNIAWPGADPAEQRRHRAVLQQVHVIDAVRTRDHPSSQAANLQARRSPRTGGRSGHARPPRQPGPPAALGPPPGPAPPETRDSGHQTSHESSPARVTTAIARCPLQPGDGSFSNSYRPRSEGTLRVDTTRPDEPLFTRWIEA